LLGFFRNSLRSAVAWGWGFSFLCLAAAASFRLRNSDWDSALSLASCLAVLDFGGGTGWLLVAPEVGRFGD
jgi:hypothetical protein